MSRAQLALNVGDLDAAVDFYRKLFGVEPVKRRPGYANFAVVEPPLKLVLIENPSAAGTLNHLGVEVASTEEVGAAQRRLAGEGVATRSEEGVTCCYAVQDKVWADGPDGTSWEVYTVLADAPPTRPEGSPLDLDPEGACCAGEVGDGGEPQPVATVTAGATGCC